MSYNVTTLQRYNATTAHGDKLRASKFLAGGACPAATSPSAQSGRNGPPWADVAPPYAARLVAARRVPTHGDAARCNKLRWALASLRLGFPNRHPRATLRAFTL